MHLKEGEKKTPFIGRLILKKNYIKVYLLIYTIKVYLLFGLSPNN